MCDINESDCCGNGCANCILDSKPMSSKRADLLHKINILHTYRKYKLIKRNQLIKNQPHIIQLKFVIASDKKQLTEFIFDCPPGHHLMMRAPLHTEAEYINKTVLSPYSPYWTDTTEFEFEIVVNLKPNGQMTKYIDNLKLNDEVEFRGPIGVFTYEPSLNNIDKALIIFCQGVAIAPTIPIIQNVIENEDDDCRIFHFSCFQNIDNIIFREKLMEFKRFWNFSNKIYLSQQKCAKCVENSNFSNCAHFKQLLKYKEQIEPHRLTLQDISSNLEGIRSVERQFVICGSNSFQEFIKDCLLKCNVNKNYIFVL